MLPVQLFRKFLSVPDLGPESRKSLRREQLTDLTFPVALAILEGGFVGVIADKIYGVAPFMLAIITAAAFIGNLSSYSWARIATARSKVPVVVFLYLAVLVCLLIIAFAPTNQLGSFILVGGVLLAKVFLTGVITVRSVVWSLNYPRHQRARTTGRLQIFSSLIVVGTTAIAGPVLDANPSTFRWMYVIATLFVLLAVYAFSRVEVLGEQRHRVAERRSLTRARVRHKSSGFLQILLNDRFFARYQVHQFLTGISNLAIEAPLIFLVSRQLQASFAMSLMITMLLPFLFSVIAVPFWARYLDKVHVTEYRIRLTAIWVLSQIAIWIGAIMGSLTVLAIARAIHGISRGGGNLAWQLGHNDFAPPGQLSAYMSVHVTLTGVRGAIAGLIGIGLYVGWPHIGWIPPYSGLGEHLFLVCTFVGAWSWIGFIRLNRALKAATAETTKIER